MSLDRSTTILRPLASEPEKVNISAARTAWPASNRTFGQFVGDRKRVWVDGVGQHDPDVVLDGGLDVEGQVIDEPRQLLVACLGVRSWHASVPFPYDVHALFFSGDAITIENELHKAFADRRVNFMLGTLHRMGCSRCSGRRSGTLRRGARRAARSSA
jgi:hypothetical protein